MHGFDSEVAGDEELAVGGLIWIVRGLPWHSAWVSPPVAGRQLLRQPEMGVPLYREGQGRLGHERTLRLGAVPSRGRWGSAWRLFALLSSASCPPGLVPAFRFLEVFLENAVGG